MATRIHRMLWSIVCGTALGLGAAGCYDSDPPQDAQADTDASLPDAAEDTEPEFATAYGMPEYGPPPEP
jgi:hypothetical protein